MAPFLGDIRQFQGGYSLDVYDVSDLRQGTTAAAFCSNLAQSGLVALELACEQIELGH